MKSEWFDRGVAQKAKYMVIVCDTFDYDDYPVYCMNREDALNRIAHPGSMQRVMEVYDLSKNRDVQLAKRRAWEI